MPKAQGPPPLNLSTTNQRQDATNPLTASTLSPVSPRSPRTPGSMPGSPSLHDSTMGQSVTGNDKKSQLVSANGSKSPSLTAVPQMPASPARTSQKHGRDVSKSFFSNLMASKSSHRLHSPDRNGAETTEKAKSKSRASSKDRTQYSLRTRVSTPELPKSSQVPIDASLEQHGSDQAPPADLEDDAIQPLSKAKSRNRFGGLLSRTKSIRLDDGSKPKPLNTDVANLSSSESQGTDRDHQYGITPKTAPMRPDHRERAFRDTSRSSIRNRSADRPPAPNAESLATQNKNHKQGLVLSSSFKDGTGNNLLLNLHHTGRGMGDRIGKAGKGFLGRITRSGSSNERELVTDDNYTCTVINLPLVRQTRRTRIAKCLEKSKDKTEFWMPALPWRCIE